MPLSRFMCLTTVLCAALSSSVIGDPAAPEPSVANGRQLYESVGCWSCHGLSGQGAMSKGIASGPRIDARLYPREAFLRQLRTPANLMPPYTRSVLSDAQAWDIYAYLQTIAPARKAQDIPVPSIPLPH